MLAITRTGYVLTLEMQDVAKRNTLTSVMIDALRRAIDGVGDARAVILRASQPCTVWSAGFDIGALGPGVDPLAPGGALMGLFHAIRDCPAPVIAMVHGSCWGGGTDLALRCDLLIADTTCTLAFTPGKIGLAYDTDGLRNIAARAGLGLAMEMLTTAEPVGAERAYARGLIQHLLAPEDLLPFTMAMADRIAALAPLSVRSAKQQLRALASATVLPAETQERIEAARLAALHSDDFTEGLAAFHARRAPNFVGR